MYVTLHHMQEQPFAHLDSCLSVLPPSKSPAKLFLHPAMLLVLAKSPATIHIKSHVHTTMSPSSYQSDLLDAIIVRFHEK